MSILKVYHNGKSGKRKLLYEHYLAKNEIGGNNLSFQVLKNSIVLAVDYYPRVILEKGEKITIKIV